MSIFSQPGLWVGAGVVLGVVFVLGRFTHAPWWRTALTAAGALAFVVGVQWAWNVGVEALIATGLATIGMAIWDESAVRLLAARRDARDAPAPNEGVDIPIPVAPGRARRVTARTAVGPGVTRAPASAPAARAARPRHASKADAPATSVARGKSTPRTAPAKRATRPAPLASSAAPRPSKPRRAKAAMPNS
jgi:hypothetical protein